MYEDIFRLPLNRHSYRSFFESCLVRQARLLVSLYVKDKSERQVSGEYCYQPRRNYICISLEEVFNNAVSFHALIKGPLEETEILMMSNCHGDFIVTLRA